MHGQKHKHTGHTDTDTQHLSSQHACASVPRASADVSIETVLDVLLGWLWLALQQAVHGHDHAGAAPATLRPPVVGQVLLHGVQLRARAVNNWQG